MERVLFLHNRASARGGKASSARLSLAEWNNEVERMCLAHYIQGQMKVAVTHDGQPMFEEASLGKVRKRVIDGRLI